MKFTKLNAERRHAKRRAFERYDLVLNRQDLFDISELIYRGYAEFIAKQSLRVAILDVVFRNKVLRTVYDKQRRCVITFLAPHMGPQKEQLRNIGCNKMEG